MVLAAEELTFTQHDNRTPLPSPVTQPSVSNTAAWINGALNESTVYLAMLPVSSFLKGLKKKPQKTDSDSVRPNSAPSFPFRRQNSSLLQTEKLVFCRQPVWKASVIKGFSLCVGRWQFHRLFRAEWEAERKEKVLLIDAVAEMQPPFQLASMKSLLRKPFVNYFSGCHKSLPCSLCLPDKYMLKWVRHITLKKNNT